MPGDDDIEQPRRRGGWDALAVCAVLATGAGVVAGLAWTRPTATTSSLDYQQSGRLSYQAPVEPTSVYGTTRVTTGQPVYTDLVSTLTIGYAYRFASSAPATVGGTEQLVATIGNGQGITRTVPLQPPTSFSGDRFDATGTLNLPTLQAIADQFAKTTVSFVGASYGVTISPQVKVNGVIDHVPLRDTFDPAVKFSLTSSALLPSASSSSSSSSSSPSSSSGGTAFVASPTGGGGGATGTGASVSEKQFAASSPGSVPSPGGRPTTMIGGLTVLNLRVVALVVLVVALAAGAFVAWPLVRDATSEDERRRIVARHGPSLIEVGALPTGFGVVVVELTTFEGLVQVAQRTECPLLHADLGEGAHAYGVVDNGTLYRYGGLPVTPSMATSWANGNGRRKPIRLPR